jgi:hypothetical protein
MLSSSVRNSDYRNGRHIKGRLLAVFSSTLAALACAFASSLSACFVIFSAAF